jgi:hypothetical protein
MSLTQNDRIFRSKSGKTFPDDSGTLGGQSFADAIAEALAREFGGSHAAVKTAARLVDANERAVRNWFDAKNGPSGEHLVVLMRHSDAVTEAVLHLAHRDQLLGSVILDEARAKLRQLLALLDDLAPP